MQNLTKEQKFLALVSVAQPGSYPNCALSRLAESGDIGLAGTGERLGFSEAEAKGIMDGWDKAAGKRAIFSLHRNRPGYEHGFQLGQQAYANRLEATQEIK